MREVIIVLSVMLYPFGFTIAWVVGGWLDNRKERQVSDTTLRFGND